MQGCAALEQKLRQCMDQPVRVGHRLRSTPSICSHHTARQGPEEEHYQLPPVENVPQDHRPSQAQLSKISVAAHATLYTICIPTARRDGRCASAHAGGVLSAITTLGRRSGEVGTVYICNLREGDKSTNHHLSITPLRSREVGRSATTLSGYHSMEARRSASELSFTQCVKQCDHVRRANALQQTISPPQACAPPVPSVTFLIHSSLRQGRACHRDLALCQLLHRTAYRQMRSAPTLPSLFSTWKPVSWSSRPASLCGSHQHTPRAYQIVILPR